MLARAFNERYIPPYRKLLNTLYTQNKELNGGGNSIGYNSSAYNSRVLKDTQHVMELDTLCLFGYKNISNNQKDSDVPSTGKYRPNEIRVNPNILKQKQDINVFFQTSHMNRYVDIC